MRAANLSANEMTALPKTMRAMILTAHGGLEKYEWREEYPAPVARAGEVLIRVGACGLNNTDVNTRTGWYSKSVRGATAGAGAGAHSDDPAWGGRALSFPRIQGADVCGEIAAVGDGVSAARIGERVITDNWIRDAHAPDDMDKAGYFGSECDGGFAEYAAIPARNALAVRSDFSDAELATFSCAYSTAEGMLTRAQVTRADTVLVPGASGGVGGALVQLAKLRGARVVALASTEKHAEVQKFGADVLLPRAPENLQDALADEKISVVADVVGGAQWMRLIETLQRGGRYACSGAIAGPIAEFDLRTFYLRDLTFYGSTIIAPQVMQSLVGYIESGKIKPPPAKVYPLRELRDAQAAFIAKKHAGKIVVAP